MCKSLFKRLVAGIILVALLVLLFPQENTYAKDYQEAHIEEYVMYEIVHVASGKVLDIKDESYSNGAEVQIWTKYKDHSNQKFMFEKDELGWKMISLHSGKVIEVRNHSKEDGSSVAQWDDAHATSQRWRIRDNGDGTVTFVNVNSNKVLDIQYGGTSNGTKAWQYTDNGTVAQKFYLNKVDLKELDYVSWERSGNPQLTNTTFFSGIVKKKEDYGITEFFTMPDPNFEHTTRIEFLSSEKIFRILQEESLRSDLGDDLKKLVSGKFTEKFIESGLKKLGLEFLDIPFLFTLVELLYSDNATWNEFVRTTDYGTGVAIITRTRYVVEPIMTPAVYNGLAKPDYRIVPEHSYMFFKWYENTLLLNMTMNEPGTWEFVYQ